MKLSLAMMVKNEAETMGRVIENIREVVDEVVICVDDQADELTWKSAEMYADKLYKFTWRNDFSYARNNVISKCTGDWVMILDGHDLLVRECSIPIIQEIKRNPPDVDAISGYMYLNCDENGVPELFYPQVRMIRRGFAWFVNPVHNVIDVARDRQMFYPQIVVKHIPSVDRMQARRLQRVEMNADVLKANLRRDKKDLRSMLYLGNTYGDYPDHYKKAKGCFTAYLKVSKGMGGRGSFINAERYEACLALAQIYVGEKKFDESRKYALAALDNIWNRREAYCLLGDLALMQDFKDEALFWYQAALWIKTPVLPTFLHGAIYSYAPHWQCAKLYAEMGQLDVALHHVTECLRFKPREPQFLNARKELEKVMAASNGGQQQVPESKSLLTAVS